MNLLNFWLNTFLITLGKQILCFLNVTEIKFALNFNYFLISFNQPLMFKNQEIPFPH